MSVKTITNPHALRKENINRAQQLSLRSVTVGNKERSTVPGKDFTKGFTITLKDIDESVINHIKNIMKPVVKEAGEVIKVPILYGNEERWKAVRKNGVLRDKNNVIILPVMVIRRTDVSMNDAMPLSFDNDVRGEFIQVARSNQWSGTNRYDRFAVQQSKKPVQEYIMTGMPDFVICSYSVIMLTSYMEQMNDLNTIWVEHLETYFGDSTNYKFLSSLDGSISDATEMPVDGERIIKNELSLSIKAYMIPEFTDNIFGKTAEMTKVMSPAKVTFCFEGNATGDQIKKQ
jgi:hypothetical protein